MYPASAALGGHNAAYSAQTHSLGYLPANSAYNPTSLSSQFNPVLYKSPLMGHSTLGQLGPSVLGTGGLTHPLASTVGTLGTAGLGMPPASYATTAFGVTNNPTLSQAPFTNPVTGALNQYSLPAYNPVTTAFTNNVTFSNPLSSQFDSIPLSAPVGMSIKLKPLEEVELGRRSSP